MRGGAEVDADVGGSPGGVLLRSGADLAVVDDLEVEASFSSAASSCSWAFASG